MTAGLVRYKLCDRQFECEGCPLDTALTGSERSRDSRESQPVWSFPDDLLYGTAHLWVRKIDDSSVRIGIDALAARLLVRVESVRLPRGGETLVPGGIACELTVNGGLIYLRSPVNGSVSRVNASLLRDASLLTRDPYDTGWLCEARMCATKECDSLFSAVEARRRVGYDLQHFRRRLVSYLFAETVGLGRTMADGGEPLTDLRQILGRESFLQLLQEIVG
jgi:glycine cleavage system H protein